MVFSSRMRLGVLVVAGLVLTSACGPTVDVKVGVESQPLDLTYGAQDKTGDAIPDRASGSGLDGTSFPGFITPPVFVSGQPKPFPPKPAAPPIIEPCPAPVSGAPAKPVGAEVSAPPAPGSYFFRRVGGLQTSAVSYQDALDSEPAALSPYVERKVANVIERESATGREFQYDVTQIETGLRTTTTYLVRPTDGIFISRVITEQEGLPATTGAPEGTESFVPRPMIRIANLPMAIEVNPGSQGTPDQTGAGVDPLTGVAMDVYFHNTGTRLVEGCGAMFEGWNIAVDSGTFRRPRVRTFAFKGEFVVSPRLGGLVISDNIELYQGVNEYEGKYFRQTSQTTLNTDVPTEPAGGEG